MRHRCRTVRREPDGDGDSRCEGVMTDDLELLRRAGEALYGDRWQSDMAHVLGVNVRTVQRWLSGERKPGPEVWTALRALVLRRIPMLAEIGLDLAKLAKALADRAEEGKSGGQQ